ncbi:phosphopantetheine-binding protein [Micromonospora sp. URMC 105]|uniref:phosphopantetheine-binding protein n=1 Tax=Micromonospora sp. URMC 105 TaxID=3423413 RepID=UPI003F1D0D09
MSEDRSRHARLLAELTEMLVEVMGDDVLLAVEIGPDTRFDADLAMESIELVALGDLLRQRYGEHVNLAAFIAGMEIDEIMALTVGQLVAYLSERLDAARTA